MGATGGPVGCCVGIGVGATGIGVGIGVGATGIGVGATGDDVGAAVGDVVGATDDADAVVSTIAPNAACSNIWTRPPRCISALFSRSTWG